MLEEFGFESGRRDLSRTQFNRLIRLANAEKDCIVGELQRPARERFRAHLPATVQYWLGGAIAYSTHSDDGELRFGSVIGFEDIRKS